MKFDVTIRQFPTLQRRPVAWFHTGTAPGGQQDAPAAEPPERA